MVTSTRARVPISSTSFQIRCQRISERTFLFDSDRVACFLPLNDPRHFGRSDIRVARLVIWQVAKVLSLSLPFFAPVPPTENSDTPWDTLFVGHERERRRRKKKKKKIARCVNPCTRQIITRLHPERARACLRDDVELLIRPDIYPSTV